MRHGAVTGLVRSALKSFVEDIRLLTQEKASLQQLQFDIYTLRQTLPRYVPPPADASMQTEQKNGSYPLFTHLQYLLPDIK